MEVESEIAKMNISLGEINIHCGRLLVAGFESCEIVHNNEVLNYTGPSDFIFPKLKFGLITYRCDNVAGYLISPFDCRRCNFSCTQEQLTSSCVQAEVQFWSGLILAILFCTVICGVFYKAIIKVAKSTSLITRSFKLKFSKTRQGSDENVVMSANDNYYEEVIKDKREAVEPDQRENNAETEEDMVESKEKRGSLNSPPSKKKSLGTLIAGLLFTKTVIACDWTVLMNSSTSVMICSPTSCHQDKPPYSISPLVGQEICFEDYENLSVLLSLKISEITMRTRYNFVYEIFDYIVINTTDFRGYYRVNTEAEDCPELNSDCSETKLTSLNSNLSQTENVLQGYSCEARRFFIPSAGAGYVCCHFFWKIKKTQSYPIFNKIDESWIVKFNLRENNHTAINTLSDLDPLINLFGFKSNTVDSISVTISNTIEKTTHSSDYLLLYKDKFYNLNSSVINEQNHYLRGCPDLLPRLDDKFWSRGVCRGKCEIAASCSCGCSYPESNIKTYLNEPNDSNYLKDFIVRKNDSSIIDSFETIDNGSVTMKIDAVKNQYTTEISAKCGIKHILSYGTTSSNESAYIVLTSYDVEDEGVVPFYSNCSFDKSYVKCDRYETMKLILKDKYDTCLLKIPALKKSLLINIEYFDLSHLTGLEEENNSTETFSDTLICVAAAGFFKTFFTTMFLFFLSVLIVTIVCQCFLKFTNHYYDKERINF